MAEPFSFSEQQAEHILDMTLGRLTRLGRANLEEEMEELRRTIAELEAILGDPARLRGVIATELGEIRAKYANDRRTAGHPRPGRARRRGPHQRRGDRRDDDPGRLHQGRAGGVVPHPGPGRARRPGSATQGRGPVDNVVHTTTLAHLCCSRTRDVSYRLRAHEVPMKERTARGTAVVNLLPLSPSETIEAIVATQDFDSERLPAVRHQDGPGEEDGVLRVRQVTARGLHRHRSARRRRARPGGGHLR